MRAGSTNHRRLIGAVGAGLLGGCLLASALGWAQEGDPSPSPDAQALIQQLEAPDVYVRQLAFLQLEALREPATAAIIRRYLASRHIDTRTFSVRALAAVEGVRAVPTLLEILKQDRSPEVRVAVILALEPLKDPAALPALITKLRDRKPEVRMAAIDAVSRFDQPEAREAIQTRWRRERNRDVRRVLEQTVDRLGLAR